MKLMRQATGLTERAKVSHLTGGILDPLLAEMISNAKPVNTSDWLARTNRMITNFQQTSLLNSNVVSRRPYDRNQAYDRITNQSYIPRPTGYQPPPGGQQSTDTNQQHSGQSFQSNIPKAITRNATTPVAVPPIAQRNPGLPGKQPAGRQSRTKPSGPCVICYSKGLPADHWRRDCTVQPVPHMNLYRTESDVGRSAESGERHDDGQANYYTQERDRDYGIQVPNSTNNTEYQQYQAYEQQQVYQQNQAYNQYQDYEQTYEQPTDQALAANARPIDDQFAQNTIPSAYLN